MQRGIVASAVTMRPVSVRQTEYNAQHKDKERKVSLLVLWCPAIVVLTRTATIHHSHSSLIDSHNIAEAFDREYRWATQSTMTGSSFEPAAKLRATSARLSSVNGAILYDVGL